MTYAYHLDENPYPSSPTPTQKDARILGGRRHKEAKASIVQCIKDLNSKVQGRDAGDNDFRVITVIQDVGSGKTHLALHIKNIRGHLNAECSYVDLSTIMPRTMPSLYMAIIKGFGDEFFVQLRAKFLTYVRERAEQGDAFARKALGYTMLNRLAGITVKEKADDMISGRGTISPEGLAQFLPRRFSFYESALMKNIISNSFGDISNLEELIGMLSAISRLAHRFLGKITIIEVDEFDGNRDSAEFVKGVVNAHIPSCILLLISTPSGYSEVQASNPPVFDRLEKANYKIDLAGSNSKEELAEIALEYIRHSDKGGRLTEKLAGSLADKIHVLYDEFPEFRSVRSVINILYHAMERSSQLSLDIIGESTIDDAIRQTCPGLRVKGSIMEVPISDFISIKNSCSDPSSEEGLRDAVLNLARLAHENGTICKLEGQNLPLDLVYQDAFGAKVGVAVVTSADGDSSIQRLSDISRSAMVDRLVILASRRIPESCNATVVNVDKSKAVDLLYFNSKYHGKKIGGKDGERAGMLARTLCIT